MWGVIFAAAMSAAIAWLVLSHLQLRSDLARKSNSNAMEIIEGLFERADEQMDELAGNRTRQESMFSFGSPKGWAQW